jgi:hypothetical protein
MKQMKEMKEMKEKTKTKHEGRRGENTPTAAAARRYDLRKVSSA